MNVNNILVPVDYSNNSDASLDYAVSLAREQAATLHLVHVYEPPFAYVDGGFSAAPAPEILPVDIEAEEARLERIVPPSDVKFERSFIVGSAAAELVDYAKEHEIDLIVMGTHGRTGLTRLLMGSVAESVVRRAPCPVVTLKQPAKQMEEAL